MALPPRPHVLGVDDGPFDKFDRREGAPGEVPVVGVLMEGHDLVEAVAVTAFPVDGEDAADFLAAWIGALRFQPALQAVVLGGITLAGLGVVDVAGLARELGVPVLVVNRRRPEDGPLLSALEAAGLETRAPLVRAAPRAREAGEGLWVAASGIDPDAAARLARDLCHKARLPEPLRLAHLVARALRDGESRGRA